MSIPVLTTGPCAVCGMPSLVWCSACATAGVAVHVCSIAHQRIAWTAHKWVCGPGKANPFTPPPISAEEVGALARAIDHAFSLKGYASLETKLKIKYGRPLPVAAGLDQLCREISNPSLERYRFAVQRWLQGSTAAELTIRLHLYEAVTQIQRVGIRSTRVDPSWYAAHVQEKLELSSPYFQLDGTSSQILHRAFIASAILPDPDVCYTDWKLLPLSFAAVCPAWVSLQRMLLPYLRFPGVQYAADDLRLLLLPLERSFPDLHIKPRFNFDEQTGTVTNYQIEASLR